MIWLLGLAAVCLTSRHSAQRPVAALIAAATAVSAVEFPVLYDDVIHSTWTGCALMVVRNGLLTAAAVLSFVRLWRSSRPLPATTHTRVRPSGPDGESQALTTAHSGA
jgi:hypothetical protein